MGVAGIKWGQCSSTIPPFLMNLNEEALLKVSFKNIDWFQICPFSKTTVFSKKALKTKKFWKIQNFFLHFWWQFYRAFQWYIVCFHTFSAQCGRIHIWPKSPNLGLGHFLENLCNIMMRESHFWSFWSQKVDFLTSYFCLFWPFFHVFGHF